MSCSSQTADTACPSSRTFLKIATLSAALCCRYRRARLLPMSPSSYVPDDYIPAGLGTPLSAEAGHARDRWANHTCVAVRTDKRRLKRHREADVVLDSIAELERLIRD